MKRLSAVFLLLACSLVASGADAPRVSRASLIPVEKSLDDRVKRLWDDNPFVLIGNTRGVYLDGWGVVLTTEVNVVTAPLGLMHPTLTKPEIDRHRQKKLERLPQLKAVLREALVASAASLDTVPPDEQILIVAFLARYPWEEETGIPAQVSFQASKRKLLEAQRNSRANLDSVIRVTEY
jgi:hypothetical protein